MRLRRCFVPSVLGIIVAVVMAIPVSVEAQMLGRFPYREGDQSLTALNILTPGTGRHLSVAETLLATAGITPPHTEDQALLYDALVQAAPSLTSENLAEFYKDNSLGVHPDDVERVYSPRPGVLVVRDGSFGVPHLFAATRADLAFGAGYVTAEDRLFYMDTFRHLGKGHLSEFLGASDANLASDRSVKLHADYTPEERQDQLDDFVRRHPDRGAQIVADLESSTKGINAFIKEAIANPLTKLPIEYVALQQLPKRWKTTDFVALLTFASWGFAGGGGQLRTAEVMAAIERQGYTSAEAREIFDDMRRSNDPEAPATADEAFPLNSNLGPVNPAAVARPDDPAALSAAIAARKPPREIDGPFGKIALRPWPDVPMSNFLGIGADLSETGRPLVVAGPQVGYLAPAVIMEMDLHAPGIHARGISFPGLFPMYPLIGRGPGYAWTGTSPSVDQSDIRAVKLCDPSGGSPDQDSRFYLRDGECLEMEVVTDKYVAKPGAGGIPSPENEDAIVVTLTTERTKVGIVQARGTVGGEPVAFTLQRPTARREIDFALSMVDLIEPGRVPDVDTMMKSLARGSIAANMLVFDGRDVGYILTGFAPKLTSGVDPDLPFWGDSEWDWDGLLAYAELPKAFNPEKGYVTNWNNKQAPGFRADTYSYGPVHRSQLLDALIQEAASDDGVVDLLELARAAQTSATQDLRGFAVLPLLLDVVGAPADARLATVTALLQEWHEAGSHRRDLDGDGDYEYAAAVAVMDLWWGRVIRGVFGPVLQDALGEIPLGNPDSRFSWSWGSHLHKDLRTVLGRPVVDPFSRIYCGGGDPGACRSIVLGALDEAVAELEASFGTDPEEWDAQEERDRITYTSLTAVLAGSSPLQGVGPAPLTGHWQNRPTFQQVLEFEP